MSNKETFTDSSHSLLRALHHSSLAKQYFEDCGRMHKQGVKYMMNIIAGNLQQSINKVRYQLPEELLKEVDKDLADSLTVEAVVEKFMLLVPQQREMIEKILDLLLAGEAIEVQQLNQQSY